MPCTLSIWTRTRLRPPAARRSAAQKSLDVVRRQLELGLRQLPRAGQCRADLSAGRGVALAQARGNRYADTAALFQALGGPATPDAAH